MGKTLKISVDWRWIAVDKLCILMATAGYSGTPLWKKLGIKPDSKIRLINPPDNYAQLLEADISGQMSREKSVPDLVHLFVTSNKEFEKEMRGLSKALQQNPDLVIWVSWFKKSSGINTDLTEDVIRNFALKNNLVDVKVCAVNDIWSGLKLVVPLAKRKTNAK